MQSDVCGIPALLSATAPRCETRLVSDAVGARPGKRARSELIAEHYHWIRGRCLQTLRHEADASDAAQEVALRMYKGLPEFDGRSNIRTWLYTIIRHECVNLIRKRQRSALSEAIKVQIEFMETERLTNDDDSTEDNDTIHAALGVLPVQCREVLQLRFFADLSLEEMGMVLGTSLSATKMRLYRALEQFARTYLQLYQQPDVSGLLPEPTRQ